MFCLHTFSSWYPRRSEERVGSPGTRVLDGCDPGPPEEQGLPLRVEHLSSPFLSLGLGLIAQTQTAP